MIPPREQWCIQIDVTNACHRKCSNCTRSLAHIAKPYFMGPEEFAAACRALVGFPQHSPADKQGRKKVIGVIGGEPLLHPQLPELCSIMQKEIRDRERRGLWTGLDIAGHKHETILRETFGYVNFNPHTEEHPSVHQPVLVAIQDVVKDEEELQRLINDCWVNKVWSGTINTKGFYFCEVAGALALLFNGPDGLNPTRGIWKAPLSEFQYQIDWACRRCGCAIPLPPRKDSEERDDVTALNLHALVQIGSPRLDRLVAFDPREYHPEKQVDTWQPNRYLKDKPWPFAKVAPSVGQWKDVRAICVCVDYADILQYTLPRMLKQFASVLVVSTPSDSSTAAIVAKHPRANLFTTTAFYDDGANFNKGKALEAGFDVMGRQGWMAVVDADVMLPSKLPEVKLSSGYLYCAHRRIMSDITCPPPENEWGSFPIRKEYEHAGFFQVFNAADPVLLDNPWYGVTWIHAGGCDSEFQALWKANHRIRLNLEVLHIGPEDTHWHGRNEPQKMETHKTLRRHFGWMYDHLGTTLQDFQRMISLASKPVRDRYSICQTCQFRRGNWCWDTPGPGSGPNRFLRRLYQGSCARWPQP